MSTALIQTTGKGLYSPIENKHKEIKWVEDSVTDRIIGNIGNTTYFSIEKYKGGYFVRQFIGNEHKFHGINIGKQYKSISIAKSVCTKLLRKEILKAVILLDNLANIKNID